MAASSAKVQKYKELVQDSQKLIAKISELEMERNEHRLVEDTLQPLDGSRRAYRLVGEVLVERTVAEVLPPVSSNRENVETAIAAFRERLETVQKEADQIKTEFETQAEHAA